MTRKFRYVFLCVVAFVITSSVVGWTFAAMAEAPIRNAYAVIEVYPSKLNEVGYGKEPSRELKLEGLGSAAKKATAQQNNF